MAATGGKTKPKKRNSVITEEQIAKQKEINVKKVKPKKYKK